MRGKDAEENRWIRLVTGVAGDYLVVKCENYSAEAPGIVPEGSGYGWKILRDIAKRYEWDFRTAYLGQEFSVQLPIRYR